MKHEVHRAYLSLGSNIDPQDNLQKALDLLREAGEIRAVSSVWESRSIGYDGPNFLNFCALFLTSLHPHEIKEEIIRPIETTLGRMRHADKNAPRTIDIDIVLFDDEPLNTEFWDYAFVTVPLAELIPDFPHPNRLERTARVAGQLQDQSWIARRSDVCLS